MLLLLVVLVVAVEVGQQQQQQQLMRMCLPWTWRCCVGGPYCRRMLRCCCRRESSAGECMEGREEGRRGLWLHQALPAFAPLCCFSSVARLAGWLLDIPPSPSLHLSPPCLLVVTFVVFHLHTQTHEPTHPPTPTHNSELMDKLYCCLLGHLYHLARGELLRLGSALQLPEAAAANASILLLGKAAFSPSKPQQQQQSGAAAAASNSRSPISSRSSSPAGKSQSAASQKQQQQQQQGRQSRNSLTAGVDLLLQASSSGALSPRMVAQLQELLMTPLCGFSMMINKYADGNSNGLTYEVHTPRLEQVGGWSHGWVVWLGGRR